MVTAVHKEHMKASPERIWKVITELAEIGWRSDLMSVGILDDDRFVETDRQGYTTTFTVTRREPYKRYEFTMENDNITGS